MRNDPGQPNADIKHERGRPIIALKKRVKAWMPKTSRHSNDWEDRDETRMRAGNTKKC